jgi:cytochrome c6
MMRNRSIAPVLALVLGAAVVAPALADGTEPKDGKSLYEAKCALCHSKDGAPKKIAEGSANLSDPEWQKKTTLETIEKQITEGKGKMPKFQGKLAPEEIKLVAAYVKTLKKS